MPLNKLFLLVNTRNDLRFFIHRFFIGMLLFFFLPADEVLRFLSDPISFLIKHTPELILLFLFAVIMYVVYLIKPQKTFLKKIQIELMKLVITLTSLFRGAFIASLPILIYGIFEYNVLLCSVYLAFFLVLIEMITSVYLDVEKFLIDCEYQNDWYIVGVESSKN